MPRPGPRRPLIAVRLRQDEIDWLDTVAAQREANRSETLRLALAYAREHMPRDYVTSA
jgi:hypothetical protein